MFRSICTSMFLGIFLSGCNPPDETSPGADLVLTGGKIQTMDDQRSWAEAICVTGRDISFVGTSEGAGACIGSQTTVIELAGRLVVPGFMDSHMHIFVGSISDLASVSARGCIDCMANEVMPP